MLAQSDSIKRRTLYNNIITVQLAPSKSAKDEMGFKLILRSFFDALQNVPQEEKKCVGRRKTKKQQQQQQQQQCDARIIF
jgi:hypothetical protein